LGLHYKTISVANKQTNELTSFLKFYSKGRRSTMKMETLHNEELHNLHS